jgi:hypothetical protein
MENKIMSLKEKLLNAFKNNISDTDCLKAIDQVLSEYPTCGKQQRLLLNEIEKISIEEIGMYDLYEIEVDWEEVINGE